MGRKIGLQLPPGAEKASVGRSEGLKAPSGRDLRKKIPRGGSDHRKTDYFIFALQGPKRKA